MIEFRSREELLGYIIKPKEFNATYMNINANVYYLYTLPKSFPAKIAGWNWLYKSDSKPPYISICRWL